MLSPPLAAARGAHEGPAPDGRLERLLRHLQEAGTDVQRGASPAPSQHGASLAPSLTGVGLGSAASPIASRGPVEPDEGLGRADDVVERHATGLPEIDALLGGGFPRGRLSEIAGPASCGRTSLAHALLARTTARGELACVIDRADAFDPSSAAEGGVDLQRVLWARPPGLPEALRCTEHVLRAQGFGLVLLDLARLGETPRLSSAVWPRLRKVAGSTSAAFVVLSCERVVGSFADLALELGTARPAFEAGPSWLAGLDGRALLVRNRLGPDQRSVRVRWWSHHERAA